MKQYLLSVVAAAIISGIVVKLMGNKGTQGAISKLVAGLFLSFTLIAPLRNISIRDLTAFSYSYSDAAQAAVAEGEAQTRQAIADSIKQGCEAYILDKAGQLDVALEVEVTLSDDTIPTPVAVRLKGRIAPNAKTKLTGIIAQDLGIPKEEQVWI